MKVIAILMLVTLAATSSILAPLTSHLPRDDQDGILRCIFDHDSATKSINSVRTFCGP